MNGDKGCSFEALLPHSTEDFLSFCFNGRWISLSKDLLELHKKMKLWQIEINYPTQLVLSDLIYVPISFCNLVFCYTEAGGQYSSG